MPFQLLLFDDLAIRWLLDKPLAEHGIGLANGERPDVFQRERSMSPPDLRLLWNGLKNSIYWSLRPDFYEQRIATIGPQKFCWQTSPGPRCDRREALPELWL